MLLRLCAQLSQRVCGAYNNKFDFDTTLDVYASSADHRSGLEGHLIRRLGVELYLRVLYWLIQLCGRF